MRCLCEMAKISCEKTKMIYTKRILLNRIERGFLEEWFTQNGYKGPYYIYGAGNCGMECASALLFAGIEIIAFIDRISDRKLLVAGREIGVISADDLTGTENEIIVASGNYEMEIERFVVTHCNNQIRRLLIFSEIKKQILRDYCLSNGNSKQERLKTSYQDLTHEQLCFYGRYESWESAQRDTSGYDDSRIVQQVLEATLSIKDRDCCYERDGVIFEGYQWNHQVLASLLYVTINLKKTDISLIDFGGALGSIRFQHPFLTAIQWNVIEQTEYVNIGRKHIHEITFWKSLDEFYKKGNSADILIVSSVLMYLRDPYTCFEDIARRGIRYLLLDRTYFSPSEDMIVAEYVPEDICCSSYPAHLLSRESIFDTLTSNGYEMVTSWYSTLEREEKQTMLYFGEDGECVYWGEGYLFELVS